MPEQRPPGPEPEDKSIESKVTEQLLGEVVTKLDAAATKLDRDVASKLGTITKQLEDVLSLHSNVGVRVQKQAAEGIKSQPGRTETDGPSTQQKVKQVSAGESREQLGKIGTQAAEGLLKRDPHKLFKAATGVATYWKSKSDGASTGGAPPNEPPGGSDWSYYGDEPEQEPDPATFQQSKLSKYLPSSKKGMMGWLAGHKAVMGGVATLGYTARQAIHGFSPQGVQDMGAQLGYERGGAYDVELFPGFGGQIPGSQFLTPAGRKGFSEQLEMLRESFAPGINLGQVKEITQALDQLGWTGGQGRQSMRAGLESVTKHYPGMDEGLKAQAADRSVRYGAASVKEFTDTLMDIPDAAKAAKVGLNEMLQQAMEFGEQSLQQGGTYVQGMKMARDWSNLTGMPAPIGQKLLENPFVQARMMQTTGLLPQQQGQLSGAFRTGEITQSVEQMYKLYRGISPRAEVNIGAYGKFKTSGKQGDLALIAEQMGIPVAEVEEIHKNASRTMARSRLSQAADMWSRARSGIEKNPNLSDAEKRRRLSQLDTHRSIKGDKDIQYGDMVDLMRRSGLSHDEIRKIEHADPSHRYAMIQDKIKDHTAKESDKAVGKTNVTIDLTDDAKKLITAKVDGSNANFNNHKRSALSGGKNLLEKYVVGPGVPAGVDATKDLVTGHPLKAIKDIVPGW